MYHIKVISDPNCSQNDLKKISRAIFLRFFILSKKQYLTSLCKFTYKNC